ncbi:MULTISPECIES: hypothetical protein [Arthrobacter]|uniref:Uncharacterized protein n=1 Tax=Arthrobacter jinronghuae TaxID=2964609 RepID=A0ABT1NQ56_9MICC|nr:MULTISPECIES: hypothetical protein [Arthrobacter]MCQ1949853.1 hypothetical protein [Arthrobacter jinronghuae]MCQ1953748.1 hypothetical protein [Arthrobacter sp. zg-Y238]MCQ1957388.1 hypothetical protein [Arthrobacter jinronghuae]UWX80003.1 hypothetical protein N2K98_07395 [Arthrobacter jinronghuae]
MTQRPIVSIDLFPDFSAMTDSTLESLCDQAFTQLEDGPVVEGLLAFYLSLQAEIQDREADTARRPELPAQQQSTPQPVSV